MYWCGKSKRGGEGGKEGQKEEKEKRRGEKPFNYCMLTLDSFPSLPPCFPPSVSQHYLRMSDGVFITIKGTLPRVSSGLFGGKAPVADLDAYDVRYLSYT